MKTLTPPNKVNGKSELSSRQCHTLTPQTINGHSARRHLNGESEAEKRTIQVNFAEPGEHASPSDRKFALRKNLDCKALLDLVCPVLYRFSKDLEWVAQNAGDLQDGIRLAQVIQLAEMYEACRGRLKDLFPGGMRKETRTTGQAALLNAMADLKTEFSTGVTQLRRDFRHQAVLNVICPTLYLFRGELDILAKQSRDEHGLQLALVLQLIESYEALSGRFSELTCAIPMRELVRTAGQQALHELLADGN